MDQPSSDQANVPGTSNWPPGPATPWFGLPLMKAMSRDYLGFAARLKAKHGDITHMRIGREHMVDLFHPETVRSLLVDHATAHIRWERGVEVFAEAHGQSLLVAEGAAWQTRRRRLQAGFAPRPVMVQASMVVHATLRALHELGESAAQQPQDMDAVMTRLTMDVIMRALFSSTAQDDAERASRAVRIISAVGMQEMFWPMTLPDWLPLPGKAKKRWALKTLDDLIWRHLNARLAEGPLSRHDDLLDMLLHCGSDDPNEEGGGRFTPEEVRDECMTIFLAGHETTASAMAWWCGLMAAHPEARRRAQVEVDQVLGGRPPTAADLPQLPWLTQTLKETLRLCPPASALMSRRLTAPVRLGPWHLPTGTLVRITPQVLHHDARWFPEPELFRPERFGTGAPPLPRGAFLPFGTGPRVCVGQHFAMMEMQLIAAMLLQQFDMTMPPDATMRSGMAALPEPDFNVTLRPRGGLLVQLRRRQAGTSARPLPVQSSHDATPPRDRCPVSHA